MGEPDQKFRKATEIYLEWLTRYCKLDQKGLEKKDKKMRESAFAFLRGTFYRWPAVFGEVDGAVQDAPEILCVGDSHLENFGTWRDLEGRLIWGLNDFDEATRLPFTSDLVRLSASARLAMEESSFLLPPDHAVDAILEGYENHLRFGPAPFVLEDRHPWLRDIAMASGAEAHKVWQGLIEKPIPAQEVDKRAKSLLEKAMPPDVAKIQFGKRRSGLGSLGRPKYVAVAEFCGGLVAREAKAAVPSALHIKTSTNNPLLEYQDIERRAIRVRDPYLTLLDGWIVRRLSPEARKIELADLTNLSDMRHFLHAVGRELANVHIGVAQSGELLSDKLKMLPNDWLRDASERAARFIHAEFQAFAE